MGSGTLPVLPLVPLCQVLDRLWKKTLCGEVSGDGTIQLGDEVSFDAKQGRTGLGCRGCGLFGFLGTLSPKPETLNRNPKP